MTVIKYTKMHLGHVIVISYANDRNRTDKNLDSQIERMLLRWLCRDFFSSSIRELSLIMTGRGGGSILENSQKNFKPPPSQEIKIQTPSRSQRIISDPNISLQRENIHILVSNACYSICSSVIAKICPVSVAYTSSKDSQKNSVSSKDN